MGSIPPALRFRMAIGFFERFIGSMMTPLMMIYLAARLGPATAGALLLGTVAVGISTSLLGGHLSDRYGRRLVLLAGSAGLALACLGMAATSALGWPLAVYACYLLEMASMTAIQPAHEAMIIDVTSADNRRAVYTFNYWSNNLALAVGALVGSFFYRHHFTGLLVCYGICIFGALCLSLRYLVESAPPRAADGQAQPKATGTGRTVRSVLDRYRGVLADRTFLCLVLAMTAVLGLEFQQSGYLGTSISAHIPANAIHVPLGHGAIGGVEMVGVMRAEGTLLVVALALVAQRVLRSFSNRASIYAGTLLFTVGYVALALISGSTNHPGVTAALLIAATAVSTVGEIVHVPAVQSVMAEIIPQDARSRYMAVFGLNAKGGQLLGAGCLSLGAVLPASGMSAVFAGIGLAALLLSRAVLAGIARPVVAPTPALDSTTG
ncbi:MFS transporter [Streptomyces sp. NPDC003233]